MREDSYFMRMLPSSGRQDHIVQVMKHGWCLCLSSECITHAFSCKMELDDSSIRLWNLCVWKACTCGCTNHAGFSPMKLLFPFTFISMHVHLKATFTYRYDLWMLSSTLFCIVFCPFLFSFFLFFFLFPHLQCRWNVTKIFLYWHSESNLSRLVWQAITGILYCMKYITLCWSVHASRLHCGSCTFGPILLNGQISAPPFTFIPQGAEAASLADLSQVSPLTTQVWIAECACAWHLLNACGYKKFWNLSNCLVIEADLFLPLYIHCSSHNSYMRGTISPSISLFAVLSCKCV